MQSAFVEQWAAMRSLDLLADEFLKASDAAVLQSHQDLAAGLVVVVDDQRLADRALGRGLRTEGDEFAGS